MRNNELKMSEVQFPNYLENLKADIAECKRTGFTIDEFLKAKFGIVDVLNYESNDFSNKQASDFKFDRVRGNVRLMQGKIMTYQEGQELLDRVISFDMAPLLNYKL